MASTSVCCASAARALAASSFWTSRSRSSCASMSLKPSTRRPISSSLCQLARSVWSPVRAHGVRHVGQAAQRHRDLPRDEIHRRQDRHQQQQAPCPGAATCARTSRRCARRAAGRARRRRLSTSGAVAAHNARWVRSSPAIAALLGPRSMNVRAACRKASMPAASFCWSGVKAAFTGTPPAATASAKSDSIPLAVASSRPSRMRYCVRVSLKRASGATAVFLQLGADPVH